VRKQNAGNRAKVGRQHEGRPTRPPPRVRARVPPRRPPLIPSNARGNTRYRQKARWQVAAAGGLQRHAAVGQPYARAARMSPPLPRLVRAAAAAAAPAPGAADSRLWRREDCVVTAQPAHAHAAKRRRSSVVRHMRHRGGGEQPEGGATGEQKGKIQVPKNASGRPRVCTQRHGIPPTPPENAPASSPVDNIRTPATSELTACFHPLRSNKRGRNITEYQREQQQCNPTEQREINGIQGE